MGTDTVVKSEPCLDLASQAHKSRPGLVRVRDPVLAGCCEDDSLQSHRTRHDQIVGCKCFLGLVEAQIAKPDGPSKNGPERNHRKQASRQRRAFVALERI